MVNHPPLSIGTPFAPHPTLRPWAILGALHNWCPMCRIIQPNLRTYPRIASLKLQCPAAGTVVLVLSRTTDDPSIMNILAWD